MTVSLENCSPICGCMVAFGILNERAPLMLVSFALVAILRFPHLALLVEAGAILFTIFADNLPSTDCVFFVPFLGAEAVIDPRLFVALIFIALSGCVLFPMFFMAFKDRSARLFSVARAIFSLVSRFRGAAFWRNEGGHGEFSQRGRCAGRLSVDALAGHLNLSNPRLAVN